MLLMVHVVNTLELRSQTTFHGPSRSLVQLVKPTAPWDSCKGKHCSRQVKAATYTSVVRPVLEYAAPVWDPYRQADIKALEQVQHRAARYVYNDYTPQTPGCVTEMVNKHGWESLQDRRQISRLSLINKAHHDSVDMAEATCLKPGDRCTKTHTGFYQEHTAHEVYHNSFPRTKREWNRLPNTATSAPTMDGFRACLYTKPGPE